MQLLQFQPILKRIRWGGRRLGTELGKEIGDAHDYAESWEVADHREDQSIVTNGSLAGTPLTQIVTSQNAALFGRHAGCQQFPLLVKFLDAHDRLSVQVHPNDEQAKRFDPHENGKTEAWVILDAKPNSRLYCGLQAGVDRQMLRQCIADNRVEECLHSFCVKPGNCVFIPAGTVHAIGEGILLAEIQQSSDLTFRLYDWGRLGTDGKPRELHIESALNCIDFDRGPVHPVVPEPTAVRSDRIHAVVPMNRQPSQPARQAGWDGCRAGWDGRDTTNASESISEKLVSCEHFAIHRHRIRRRFPLDADDRFHVLITLAGAADVRTGRDGISMRRGSTVVLPAERESAIVEPAQPACRSEAEVILLDAFLP